MNLVPFGGSNVFSSSETPREINWDNQETRKEVVADYLLDGVVTTKVNGIANFNLERNVVQSSYNRRENRTDLKLNSHYQSPITLEFPSISSDIRSGINTRDTRKKYNPNSAVKLPDFLQ